MVAGLSPADGFAAHSSQRSGRWIPSGGAPSGLLATSAGEGVPILGSKRERMDSVLSVAKACDTTQLDLSAAEGFLLSRIDGLTPWRFLRQIGGLPVEQVDACL